jgi:hypothetical protein
MAARLEPRAEQCDVRGTTNAIRAFYHDQFTAVFFVFYTRKRRAVKEFVFNEILTAFSSDVE